MSQVAYVYARYSSAGQRGESIDAQLQAIREYCKKESIHIARIFVDEAETAKFDDRPEFQNMFSVIRNAPPDLVVVHKLDRFARNRYDAAVYRRKLKEQGARLLSVLEPMDDSPESIILESVLDGMAEYYSQNLAREVMKGMRQSAQKGLWCGGKPPLGYVAVNQNLVIEPEAAATIRRIYDLFLEGYGYKTIASILNEEGRRTATGGPWYKSSIHTILTNERYTGVYIYNQRAGARSDGTRNGHKHKPIEEQIRVEDKIPAIIDRETWEKVKLKMDSRKKGPQPRRTGRNANYLLTGLMFCGECGASFVGSGYRAPGQYFYACTKRSTKACSNPTISANWIEGHVIRELKERVFSDAAIEAMVPKILEEVKKRTAGQASEREGIKAKMKDVQTKISRLLDMIEDGSADPDVKERLAARRDELNKLRDRELNLQDKGELRFTDKMVRDYLASFRANLESEDPALKRKALETFVQRIEVYPDRVDLRFKIAPVDKVGAGQPFWSLSTVVPRVGKPGNNGKGRH
jgi:site-specific DNA recombinase